LSTGFRSLFTKSRRNKRAELRCRSAWPWEQHVIFVNFHYSPENNNENCQTSATSQIMAVFPAGPAYQGAIHMTVNYKSLITLEKWELLRASGSATYAGMSDALLICSKPYIDGSAHLQHHLSPYQPWICSKVGVLKRILRN
jgi:hypothetical protein